MLCQRTVSTPSTAPQPAHVAESDPTLITSGCSLLCRKAVKAPGKVLSPAPTTQRPRRSRLAALSAQLQHRARKSAAHFALQWRQSYDKHDANVETNAATDETWDTVDTFLHTVSMQLLHIGGA